MKLEFIVSVKKRFSVHCQVEWIQKTKWYSVNKTIVIVTVLLGLQLTNSIYWKNIQQNKIS